MKMGKQYRRSSWKQAATRVSASLAGLALVGVSFFGGTLSATADDTGAPPPETSKKVFVCKYVGTPGVDERLKEGQNPISVSVNAIQNNGWDGNIPGEFSDAHERSLVVGYDTGEGAPPCPGVNNTPPEEEDPLRADAHIDRIPATCTSGEVLVYVDPEDAAKYITNATWSGTASGTTGPASYSVTATAITGALFDGGGPTITFSGDLDPQLPADQCAPPPPPTFGTCEVTNNPVLVYQHQAAAAGFGQTYQRDGGALTWTTDGVQLSTPASNDKITFGLTSADFYIPLSGLTALSYTLNHVQDGSIPSQRLSINVPVDVNGSAAGGWTTIVVEAIYNGMSYDAFKGGDAIVWSSNAIPGFPNRDTFLSWDSLLENNPDAVILGQILANQGGGNAGLIDVLTSLTVGNLSGCTTYTFAATPATPEEPADLTGNDVVRGQTVCEVENENYNKVPVTTTPWTRSPTTFNTETQEWEFGPKVFGAPVVTYEPAEGEGVCDEPETPKVIEVLPTLTGTLGTCQAAGTLTGTDSGEGYTLLSKNPLLSAVGTNTWVWAASEGWVFPGNEETFSLSADVGAQKTGADCATTPKGDDKLAQTGANDPSMTVALSALLMALGAGFVLLRRRRSFQ